MPNDKLTMSQAVREYKKVSRQAIHQAIKGGRLRAVQVESALVSSGWLYMFTRKDFERTFKISRAE